LPGNDSDDEGEEMNIGGGGRCRLCRRSAELND
jgi:hypothetical protein